MSIAKPLNIYGQAVQDHITKWLEKRLPDLRKEAKESHIQAMNSYGAGFDSGYLQAFVDILETIHSGEVYLGQ